MVVGTTHAVACVAGVFCAAVDVHVYKHVLANCTVGSQDVGLPTL